MASRSLGTLTIDLIAKTFGFEQGMDRTARGFEKRVKDLERSAKKLGATIGTALAVGVTAAGAALAKITTDAVNYADQLDELSNRLGISTEQLSAWGYAAKLTGSDLESLASTIPRLSKNLAAAMDEGGRQAQLFEALGVSVTDAAGNLRDVEDVLPEIADRFKQLKNDTTEAALAQELFGKSGTEFLEFLNLGSDGLAEMAGEARELGAVVDGQTAASAAQFKDELDKLSTAATGLGTQIASQLLPVVVALVGDMTDWVKQGDLARNITTLITTAVNLGVGAINAYNNAVNRTSIAIGTAVETASGWLEIQRQISTLGFAEGSISGGWERIKNAFPKGQSELDDLVARQNSPRISVPIPGVDEIDFTRGAPVAPGETADPRLKALQDRINKLLAGGDASRKSAKATKELTEAEKEWQEVMEVNALIDEQVQDFRSQQIQDAYELEKAREAGIARAQDQIEDMEFELGLLRLSNIERAKEVELRYAGADATEEQRTRIAELAQAIEKERYQTDRQVELMDDLRHETTGFFHDLKDGVGIWDSLTNAADRFFDSVFDWAAQGVTDMLFGQRGDTAGGSMGSWIDAIAGFFGGGKETGGWAMPNTLYEVNERGMEMATVRGRDYLLTGSSPVEITPNHRIGTTGGFSQTLNVTVTGRPDRRTPEQIGRAAGREAARAMARTGR